MICGSFRGTRRFWPCTTTDTVISRMDRAFNGVSAALQAAPWKKSAARPVRSAPRMFIREFGELDSCQSARVGDFAEAREPLSMRQAGIQGLQPAHYARTATPQ